ncbi:MAG TPA: hypothetical protein VJN64_04475 [Terriglobales bacterium]|nr:hypothetical protein [Terriglobales bacterium]
MLETELQNEQVFAEQPELTPLDQLRQQWMQQPGFTPLIKQKNVIDQNAALLPYAGVASLPGWNWPWTFAFKGLIIFAIVVSGFNWLATRHSGKLEDDITRLQQNMQAEADRQQGIIDATEAEIRRISRSTKNTFTLHMANRPLSREEALAELNASLQDTRSSLQQYREHAALRERELRAREGVLAIAESGTPLIFVLALVLAAGGVRRAVQRSHSRNRHARNSGDLYLYFATAKGMALNLVFLAFLHFGLSSSGWGFSSFSQSVGPVFWVVYWAGFYLLLLWYFAAIASDLYAALQLRAPANRWSFQNNFLMKIHNSVLLTFAELELPFLVACYFLYVTGKHLV